MGWEDICAWASLATLWHIAMCAAYNALSHQLSQQTYIPKGCSDANTKCCSDKVEIMHCKLTTTSIADSIDKEYSSNKASGTWVMGTFHNAFTDSTRLRKR